MPDPKKVRDVLTAAGFTECKTLPPAAGRVAQSIPGFRIHTLGVERRALFVFHIGKGRGKAVSKYEQALVAAGYIVTTERDGLKIANSKVPMEQGRLIQNRRAR
jgi:hypothetical protein